MMPDKAPRERKPYKLWHIDDVFELEPPKWLIDGVIPEGGSVVLYGPTNIGKSLIGLDWAFRMSLGHRWLGLDIPDPVKVMYIYAEGGHDLQSRYAAWMEGNSINNWHNLEQNLRFVGLDEEINLRWDPDKEADAPEGVLKLYDTAEEFDPDVIVYDPAQEVWRGMDSNSDRHVAMLWRVVKELSRQHGAASIILHHTRKSDDQFRGATTWLDLADLGYVVREQSEGSPVLELVRTKNRFGPNGTKWAMERKVVEIDRIGMLRGRSSVYVGPQNQIKRKQTAEERRVIELLTHGPKSYTELAVAVFDRRTGSPMQRVLGHLIKDGMVQKMEGKRGLYALTAMLGGD